MLLFRRYPPFVWAGLALLALVALIPFGAQAEGRFDAMPRTAIISAFGPELTALAQATTEQQVYVAGGARFITGRLEGQPVVLCLSGMSMVNAALTAQSLIDHFQVSRIVFSGIAGGVDPGLDVGDVVVADQWAEDMESVLAREVSPGRFQPPDGEPVWAAPFGMIYPKAVEATRTPGETEHKTWFAVDPGLLATARRAAAMAQLKRCIGALCLKGSPKVVVGGSGVSGQSFVDNAAFRAYVFSTFHARVIDMESAAVAQAAYVNKTPFIAFRSLSDLAGGDPAQNQAHIFFQLAADNAAAVVRAFLRALG